MEVVGLVLGVVGVISPLVDTAIDLCDLYQSSSNFGLDVNAFRSVIIKPNEATEQYSSLSESIRIAVARRQAKSFEDILLTEKRFSWLPGSLFHDLEPSLQQEFYDILQELKRCLIIFVELGKSYGAGSYEPAPVQNQIAGQETQIIDSEARAKAYQKSVSWAKRVKWSAKDKKAMVELVNEIEHWTNLLRLTIQDVLSSHPGFKELEKLEDLGKHLDEQATDIHQAISIRRILLTKPTNLTEPASVISMDDVSILPAVNEIALGTLIANKTTVLIETKIFNTVNPAEDAKRLAKAEQLATLLKHTADPTSRFLNAQGYNYDPVDGCARVFYRIPESLLPSPVSLQQLYSVKFRDIRPPLELRFQLALLVTGSLFYLHSLGWVHKSFSSSNILFFPVKAKRSTPWPVVDRGQSEKVSFPQILQDSQVKVVGFDLARPEAEQSSVSKHDDAAANWYRHPARWGVPTESFTTLHDLYALGAVLLEIGLWQRLDTLNRHHVLTNDPFETQQLMLSHATQRLPYTMGSKYASIVVGYLNGRFEDSGSSTPAIGVNASDPNHPAIRLGVLRDLNKISACL